MPISIIKHEYIHSSKPKMEQIITQTHNQDLNLKDTELRLGLPGAESPERTNQDLNLKCLVSGAKRVFSDTINIGSNYVKGGVASSLSSPKHVLDGNHSQDSIVASKAQAVGWPPIRSFRKNSMAAKNTKNEDDPNAKIGSCVYVKVSMDGAPYLRKVDLKIYSNYLDLSLALEKMFSSFTLGQCGTHGIPRRDGSNESPLMNLLSGSEYVLSYEDKDGDLMLVGDVPWNMFTCSCKRMRIMKSSNAIGLAPRAVEECKSHN